VVQFVAVRDRTVLPAIVRALLPGLPARLADPEGAVCPTHWTQAAVERWLWALLAQRWTAAAAAPSYADLLGQASAAARVGATRLRLCLPGRWQPSAPQRRLWGSLLQAFGRPVRARAPAASRGVHCRPRGAYAVAASSLLATVGLASPGAH